MSAHTEWQPIETAPADRTIVVVRAIEVRVMPHGRLYTSDPYCAWRDVVDGVWVRWPLSYEPTHWTPLPALPVNS